MLHDRMTQCRYYRPPETFSFADRPQPVCHVDVMGEGRTALVHANTELGLWTRLLLISCIISGANVCIANVASLLFLWIFTKLCSVMLMLEVRSVAVLITWNDPEICWGRGKSCQKLLHFC